MLQTTQCQNPLPVGASGSKHVTAKLLVPSGAPDHDSWGEMFLPAQPNPKDSDNTWSRLRWSPSLKLALVNDKGMAPLLSGYLLARDLNERASRVRVCPRLERHVP